MQRHEYSIDIDATIDEVWEVFWHRAPDRRQHGKSDAGEEATVREPGIPARREPWPERPGPQGRERGNVRIDILHPGDEQGNGLVRTCWFPVPKWLLSGGVGRSWEWLTEVKPKESWRYDAVGKPLWSHATGRTRLEDLGGGRTRIHFSEEYEAFNPVMRLLFERRVHKAISRSNDDILAKIEMGVRYHRRTERREAGEAEETA